MNNKILKGGIDLHIHTTKSHGMITVEETIKDAEDENLRAIAITDHNTFAIKEPRKVNDLEVIPGAEFSTLYKNKSGNCQFIRLTADSWLFFYILKGKKIW